MSTLIVDELYPGVTFEQPVKIPRNIMVAHVRPWIYKHGVIVDGNLQLQIYDGATLLTTSTITFTEINSAFTENYGHGYIRFDFDLVQLNVPETSSEKEYTFKYSMVGHSLDLNNFMGIVRQYEHKIYTTYGDVVSGEGVNDMIEPSGLEIYEFLGV